MKCCVLFALFVLAVAQDRLHDPWEASRHSDSDCLTLAQFTQMWEIFDANNDGIITHLEFNMAYSRFHFENEEQEDMFYLQMDKNDDARLTATDFHLLFRFYDIDASGCVSHMEFHRIWTAMVAN